MMESPDVAAFARHEVLDACDRLKQQLRELRKSREATAGGVHEIRKRAKAVRGGLALFRIGQSAGREIQAIGRLLSATRDAASRQATWDRLGWQEDARVAAAISSLLGQQSEAMSGPPPPGAVAWCLERVDAAQRNLRQLPAETLTKSFRQGLTRLGRRLRQRCGRLECGRDAGFHEARKAVKAWTGARRFLPAGLPRDHRSLDRLAERLGHENDLATLSGWLEEHGFTERFAPDLWKTVGKARHRLQRKVIRHLPSLESLERRT